MTSTRKTRHSIRNKAAALTLGLGGAPGIDKDEQVAHVAKLIELSKKITEELTALHMTLAERDFEQHQANKKGTLTPTDEKTFHDIINAEVWASADEQEDADSDADDIG